jgi:predicted HD phosphohydrolase
MSTILSFTPAGKAEHIISLLDASADTPYIGESISQLEHSLQCAHFAATAQMDDETVVAALLHDVGQFVPENELQAILGEQTKVQDMVSSTASETSGEAKPEVEGSVGRFGHDELGAQYLSAVGFSEKVSRLVGSHVQAKRYLCAIDASYYDTLSQASKQSLKHQGGPMDGTQKEDFANSPWCEEMCRLRRWDDGAKLVDFNVPRAQAYQAVIEKLLH